ncbi:N-acetylmuramoyl-L-alanine amidase [Lysinibacillus piscis]|uniref:MurNAc-LAA domain-containing protein n=1 Tax=Lysinibacillus piscis TaxID=2518931 RepID=A0ABQ5NMH9_9BACI|nr:N-acetylmuramoyl-L-alanine amidase [Lysinibacillus sp. KH24]GLC89317.1 hypothetical protein LYSBPC_24440 [Lysinibacillus sp. KH24]
MKPTKIELHVGHYGDRTGAHGIVDEVQYARKFIKRIYDILIANRVPATFYEDKTSKNQNQNINNFINHHNQDRNGFIVSGHLNASVFMTEQSIGAEVLYYDQATVAKQVVDAICSAGGLKNRGAKKRTNLGVLVSTYEPAILIEFGFVNSKEDVKLLDKNFEAICQSIAVVLAEHIGYKISKKELEKKEEKTMELLNETGRKEARELIKRACKEGVFDAKYHTDEKVNNYSDADLIGYSIAYVNRTVK